MDRRRRDQLALESVRAISQGKTTLPSASRAASASSLSIASVAAASIGPLAIFT